MPQEETPSWAKGVKSIIDAIQTPLALLGLFGIIIGWCINQILPIKEGTKLEVNVNVSYGLLTLFAILILIAGGLAIFKPENLIYDKEAKLRDKGKPPFGTSDHPVNTNTETKNVVPNE